MNAKIYDKNLLHILQKFLFVVEKFFEKNKTLKCFLNCKILLYFFILFEILRKRRKTTYLKSFHFDGNVMLSFLEDVRVLLDFVHRVIDFGGILSRDIF
jgi:hypothetical protein